MGIAFSRSTALSLATRPTGNYNVSSLQRCCWPLTPLTTPSLETPALFWIKMLPLRVHYWVPSLVAMHGRNGDDGGQKAAETARWCSQRGAQKAAIDATISTQVTKDEQLYIDIDLQCCIFLLISQRQLDHKEVVMYAEKQQKLPIGAVSGAYAKNCNQCNHFNSSSHKG